MIDMESLVAVALAFLVVTVSPGPANIAVATVSMSSGRRNGLLFGLGLSFGLAFWGLVAATGMGAVMQSSANALFALKIAGGLYLLWLAWQSARSAMAPGEGEVALRRTEKWFLRGLFLNLSNPKAVVAWMAALSMGLGAGDGSGQLMVATALCMAIGFANYASHALAFSLPGFMAAYKRARRWVDGVVAGLFAIAGLGILRSAFSRST
ncbi:MAG: LysE family translocator [Pseudomonadota bacterium]